jgi:hypothetical protein
MAITSLRKRPRPDTLTNQPRSSSSLARRIYLGVLLSAIGWGGYQLLGPLVLMDAEGLVMQERTSVAAEYTAQVVSVSVRPGDQVNPGDPLCVVVSTQMLDLISQLSSREAEFRSRRDRIDARLKAIAETLPSAELQASEARKARAGIDQAMKGGYTTVTRRSDFVQRQYEAEREVASLQAEARGLEGERVAVLGDLDRVADALSKARSVYHEGVVTATAAGTVGPRVAAPGTVLRVGDSFADLYHGHKQVIAYLPVGRLYSVQNGDRVMISDGTSSQPGRIEGLADLADALPAEFQPRSRGVERRQVARIAFEGEAAMPLLATVGVSANSGVEDLVSVVRAQAASLRAHLERAADTHEEARH